MTVHPFRRVPVHFLITLLLLSATLGASLWADRREPSPLATPLESISSQIAGWTSDGNITLRDRIAASLAATSYLSRTYRKGQSQLDMFTAFYAQQRAGDTMHSPKYCLPGGGWEFADMRTINLDLPGPKVTVNRAVIQRGGERQIMLYWYQSPTRIVASEYQNKFFLVWDGLVHGNQGGSIVRVMLSDGPGAEAEAVNFAVNLIPQMRRSLGATGY
jgi:EpsI family protein